MPYLPLRLIRGLGNTLGWAGFWCLGAQRRLALEHLEQALGRDHTLRARQRIARRSFQQLGMTVLEWFKYPRLTARALQRLIAVDGIERVHAALARGRGVIVVSGHFGNWELLAAYFGTHGLRGGVVARRLRYPEYETWLKDMRRAKGVETFERETSFKELLRRLKDNQCIGIMPDQDVDSVDGIFVEFFGRPTYTPTGPALLAVLTGATLLPAYIIREQGRFRIRIEEPIAAIAGGDRDTQVRELTQAWSRVAERFIRQYPDHWVWMHRRWKTQPATTVEALHS